MSEQPTDDPVTEQDVQRAMATYSADGQADDASGGSAGDEQLQATEEQTNEDGMPHGHV